MQPHRNNLYQINPNIKFRTEYFGALARNLSNGEIYQLGIKESLALLYFTEPHFTSISSVAINIINKHFAFTQAKWGSIVNKLIELSLLIRLDNYEIEPVNIESTLEACCITLKKSLKRNTIKPFWAHIQPFTRCNQRCIHCYCNGGPKAEAFVLSTHDWMFIIDKLEAYGLFDIYVTGGENFMYPQFFEMSKHILKKKLGFGLSTNASIISKKVMDQVRALNLKKIQVSLDGATARTYEFIRGAPGMFDRVLKGIELLSQYVEPVINTVVNKINFHELPLIINIGKNFGVSKFKFFPQKNCGRSKENLNILYSDSEIKTTIIPSILELSRKHNVQIETIGSDNCGSGLVGFAVDQRGNAYPCIFGIENPDQRIGNLLYDNLDDIWFGSKKLFEFRSKKGGKYCHRCEY